jgi:signal transduction histidine kinase
VSVIGRIRLPRPTIRLRLTLLYGVLFLASGAALLAVTYVLVASATSDPLVYRDPNGQLTVTLSGGGEVGPVATDEASTVVTEGSSGGPAPVGPDDDEIQALAEAQHAAQMGQLLTWSGVALAIMAVASVGIGWLVAGRVLDPMRRLTADVRQISTTNLHERLALHGPDDELKELGGTFNDLLGRLERSFEAQRQLVANASHELRTPLARQRTLLQVALADPELTADSLRATAERVLAAGDQQEELIDALIALARGERGLDHHEPVDLAPGDGRRHSGQASGCRESRPRAGDPAGVGAPIRGPPPHRAAGGEPHRQRRAIQPPGWSGRGHDGRGGGPRHSACGQRRAPGG